MRQISGYPAAVAGAVARATETPFASHVWWAENPPSPLVPSKPTYVARRHLRDLVWLGMMLFSL
jgi:hypothetical protein